MRPSTLMALSFIVISAQSYAASDQIPKQQQIIEVSVTDTYATIIIADTFSDTQGCGRPASNIFLIDLTASEGKEMFAAALSAASASKSIGLGLNGCVGTYPKIYRVDVLF